MIEHCVFMIRRLGPYHAARMEAAAMVIPRITVVETSEIDKVNSWERRIPSHSGIKVHTLFPDQDESTLDPREVRGKVEQALSHFDPGIVVVGGWHARISRMALSWCIRQGLPRVLVSESQEKDKRRFSGIELVKRSLVNLFTSAFVGGSSHRDYLIRLGMPPERISLGYDVVDNEHFQVGATEVRCQTGKHRGGRQLPGRYFLCVCRFVQKKNLPLVIEAYRLYRNLGAPGDWKLVLAGEGPLGSNIRRVIGRSGLHEHVLLPGTLGYHDLPFYYGLAEVLVLASKSEPWGLVVNEAMASGLPVLVSKNCGCAPDLVKEGQNGWTFDPENPTELARLLTSIAAGNHDLGAMGRKSLEIISRWSPRRFGEGLAQALRIAWEAPPRGERIRDKIVLSILDRG